MPTLTFDETGAEPVLDAFGWQVADDPEGLVVDADGEPVTSLHGHRVTVHQVSGVVADDQGEPVPLRDGFTSICEYVAWRREHERGELDAE